MERTKAEDHSRRSSIESAIDRVTSWKRIWRRDKGKGEDFKLARSMEDMPDLEHSTNIIHHRPLWDSFDDICSKLENNIPASSENEVATT